MINKKYLEILLLTLICVSYLGVMAVKIYGPATAYEEIYEEALRLAEVFKYGDSHAFFQVQVTPDLKLPVFTNNPYNPRTEIEIDR